MRLLILGANGFIGSHLVDYLTNLGHVVEGCDNSNDITSNVHCFSFLSDEFKLFFINNRFDLCINAAGSGNVSLSVQEPLYDFESNTVATFRILELIRLHQSDCRYIHVSSAAVYGAPKKMPIIERIKSNPVSPYGYHKFLSEIICNEYRVLYNCKIAVLRPFSVYGEGLRKQLFWELGNKIIKSNTGLVELSGTGFETRDFIHISDFCNIVGLIISKSKFNCDVYNVATGIETSIKSVTTIIEERYPHIKFVFNGSIRKGDPKNWKSDVSKITKLGFEPTVNLFQGLNLYLDWLQTQVLNNE